MKRIPPKGNASTPKESDFPKIASPAQRALAGAGCAHLKQLTRVSEAELLQLHGVGRRRSANYGRRWRSAAGRFGGREKLKNCREWLRNQFECVLCGCFYR